MTVHPRDLKQIVDLLRDIRDELREANSPDVINVGVEPAEVVKNWQGNKIRDVPKKVRWNNQTWEVAGPTGEHHIHLRRVIHEYSGNYWRRVIAPLSQVTYL